MVISAINHSCGSYKPTYLTMGHHLVGLVQLHSIILRQNTKIPLPALTGTSPRARSLQSDGGEAMPGWKSGAIYRNTKHNKVLQVSLKHNITVTYANEDVSKIGCKQNRIRFERQTWGGFYQQKCDCVNQKCCSSGCDRQNMDAYNHTIELRSSGYELQQTPVCGFNELGATLRKADGPTKIHSTVGIKLCHSNSTSFQRGYLTTSIFYVKIASRFYTFLRYFLP